MGARLENNNPQVQQQPENAFYNHQNNNMGFQSVNNNQNINSTYKLTLIRPKDFVGSLVKYKIFIDNNQVGTIKNGETVVLDVTSGNHTISFNKTMDQNINISSDTYADVVVIAGNKFGLTNIRDNTGLNIQNNELNTESVDKIIKSAKGPLIFSCACIVITFLLLLMVNMVVSPWMYGISIGYTIINLSSIKKHKQVLNDKYKSLITLDVISIVVSIVGMIISGYLMIG